MPIVELEGDLQFHRPIMLASNYNPISLSAKALTATSAALGDLHRYPDGSAFYLKRRLAERLGVTADEIVVGNGSNEIIELVVRTFIRMGDEAVMSDQAFVIYRLVVQAAGGVPRSVPVGNFTRELDAVD